jgi:hypothetical protein
VVGGSASSRGSWADRSLVPTNLTSNQESSTQRRCATSVATHIRGEPGNGVSRACSSDNSSHFNRTVARRQSSQPASHLALARVPQRPSSRHRPRLTEHPAVCGLLVPRSARSLGHVRCLG